MPSRRSSGGRCRLPSTPARPKEKALGGRDERGLRGDLWRFAEVDLTRIDGISVGTARTILTEVGLDLAAFPSERHFVSWLRLAPRTAVSGGKPLARKKSGGMGSNRVAAVAADGSGGPAALAQRPGSHLPADRPAEGLSGWLSLRRPASWPSWCTACCAGGRITWISASRFYELRFRQERIAGMQRAA